MLLALHVLRELALRVEAEVATGAVELAGGSSELGVVGVLCAGAALGELCSDDGRGRLPRSHGGSRRGR